MRLLLVFRYKERIIQSPAVPPLNRKKLENNDELDVPNEGFSLKRSGKIIRTVRNSSGQTRTWTPPTFTDSDTKEECTNPNVQILKKSVIFAEVSSYEIY